LSVLETNTFDPEEGFDEYLVEEVRKHRILWDTSAQGYKDTPNNLVFFGWSEPK
jgi:hypothetical protein